MTAPVLTETSKIRIVKIRLIECNYDLNLDYDPEKNPAVDARIDFMIGREFVRPLRLAARLGVRIFQDDEAAPFRLFVGYEGLFEVANDDALPGLQTFAKYNAFSVLLPYLREVVTAVTSRAGFPPLILPLMNLRVLVDLVDQADSADEATKSPEQEEAAKVE